MEKKEAAELLYMEGYSQSDIAKVLKLSQNTISAYAKKGQWKRKKVAANVKSDNAVQRIIDLIDYQTQALERRKNKWLEEDPESTKLIERGDIDALQKLFTTIRKDAKKFSDYVHVMKEFLNYLQAEDLELAQSITELSTEFLNIKRKDLD